MLTVLLTESGCVYWNTFYNAKRLFRDAEKQNKGASSTGGISPNKRLYEDAIAKAAKVVQRHPKSKYHDDALFLVGVCYFRMGNYLKSEGAFRELVVTHPKSDLLEESHLYLSRCRLSLGDEPGAFRAFTDLAETARKPEWRSEAIFQRSEYFARHEALDSAVAGFQQILADYPNSERAHEARLRDADVLRQLKRPHDAIAVYEPLIQNEAIPLRYAALVGTGQAYYEAGLPDSGVTIFEQMTDDEHYADSAGPVRLLLARGLKDRGDLDVAWRQYEQVTATLETTRWSAEAYFNMAEIKQFNDLDLIGAKELYDKSRGEFAQGKLAALALTRSANITKLENFRKQLGRGDLATGGNRLAAAGSRVYDPEALPRLERLAPYSPKWARPQVDLPVPAEIAAPGSEIETFGPPATDQEGDEPLVFGPPPPDDDGGGAPLFGPPVLEYGPPVATADVETGDSKGGESTSPGDVPSDEDSLSIYGPPVDEQELAWNRWRDVLIPEPAWARLLGGDSVYGPPSPGYLYRFGEGNLFGPPTPDSLILASMGYSPEEKAAKAKRQERAAQRAQQKEELSKVEADAAIQTLLAELYRFDLSYPDSALVEYDNMVERFTGTPFAAKALLASADILFNELRDSSQATARLERILAEYPHTDYATDAIARLGLKGTKADTSHPAAVYADAERAYLEAGDPRKAITAFTAFIDRFPQSRLVPNAEYAIAALNDWYFPTEDSSVIWAYKEISASYPQTDFARAVSERLSTSVPRPPKRTAPPAAKGDTTRVGKGGGEAAKKDTTKAVRFPLAPRAKKKAGQFVYPSSEVGTDLKEHVVVYKILIDFSGSIAQYELIEKSPSFEINEATKRVLDSTRFNTDSIPPESLNMWYRYEILVTPPAPAYDEFQQYRINPADPGQHNPQ